MSSSYSKLARSAMESIEEQPAFNPHLEGEQDPQQAEAYIDSTVDAAAGEIAAANDIDASIERNVAAMESIRQIYERLESHGDRPIDANTESVLNFGLEQVQAMVVSYDTVQVEVERTKAEVEESKKPGVGARVVEAAKKIFQRILDFLKSLWDRLVDFVHKLLGAASQLRHRIKQLKVEAAKHDLRAEPKGRTLESPSIVQALAIGDSFMTDSNKLVDAMIAAHKTANEFDESMISAYNRDMRQVNENLRSYNIHELEKALNSEIVLGGAFKEVRSLKKNTRMFRSTVMPGNKYVYVVQEVIIRNGTYYGTKYNVKLEGYSYEGEEGSTDNNEIVSTQIPLMDVTAIMKTADHLDSLLSGMSRDRDLAQKLKAVSGEVRRSMIPSPVGMALTSVFHQRYAAAGRATVLVNTQLIRGAMAIVRWADLTLQEYPKKSAA